MRPRLLAPLVVLLVPACPSGGETSTTTGFESGPATSGGPGPVSFGTSGDASTAEAPTTDSPTTTSTTSTLSTTDEPTSTGEPLTTTGDTTTGLTTSGTGTSSTGDTTSDTDLLPTCGDGVLGDDEQCDDGNNNNDDACREDCTAATAVLALIGVGTQAAIAATFTPGLGWTHAPAPMGVAEAELETTPDGAMAVLRRASAMQDEHNELWYARWSASDPALFTMFAKVGEFGFAMDGPSLAAVADTVTLAFLGTDNKHYTALFTADTWAAFTKLPAGMVQLQAFGPSAAALVPGTVETYAAYTGDDARIYYSAKSSPGGAWQASQGTPPASVLGPPVGVVDEEGDLVLAYVRKSDGKLALSKLLTPQNAWAKEALVHETAITGSDIAFVRLATGSYAVAWRGFDNEGIYLAAGTAYDAWDAPLTVELPQGLTTPPTLVHGVFGADIEVLYAAAGKLRHARIADDKVVPPIDVPDITGATSVAATRVQLTP